jgi:hypothetical protein
MLRNSLTDLSFLCGIQGSDLSAPAGVPDLQSGLAACFGSPFQANGWDCKGTLRGLASWLDGLPLWVLGAMCACFVLCRGSCTRVDEGVAAG